MEVEKERKHSKHNEKQAKQLAIEDAISNAVPYTKESTKYKKIVNATSQFICEAMMPLSVVDEPSFRKLLLTADSRINLPHRTYFSTKIIPEQYHLVRSVIENEISHASHITLTSDLWTSQHQNRAYISLTVHFVDNSFNQVSRSLQTLEIPQDHTADSISTVLSTMLKDWKINEKVFAATTDNA